jgi:fatty acid desaturase
MPVQATPPVKTGARPAVIVWGTLIALIGVWIMLSVAGSDFSGEFALIILMALAGLTLIGSALVAALRRPKR